MRLTYDPRHNIAYIRFGKKQGEVETIKVSEELCIDLSPDGKVYGIELLNANEQLRPEKRQLPGFWTGSGTSAEFAQLPWNDGGDVGCSDREGEGIGLDKIFSSKIFFFL